MKHMWARVLCVMLISIIYFIEKAFSKSKCNTGMNSGIELEAVVDENLGWGAPAERFARLGIHLPGDGVELALQMHAEVGSPLERMVCAMRVKSPFCQSA